MCLFQDSEIEMLADISHLQEIIDQLCMHTGDPNILPPASEQVILDATGVDRLAWSFQVLRCFFALSVTVIQERMV